MPVSLPFLNRDAFLVRPRERFAHWLRSLDEDATKEDTEAMLNGHGTIYLVDEFATGGGQEAERYLAKNWRTIAASEFGGWWEDEDDWPRLAGFKQFEEFFQWSHVEMVHDMGRTSMTLE